jgi:hypothetical protein
MRDFTSHNVYRGVAGYYLIYDEWDSDDETDASVWVDGNGVEQRLGLQNQVQHNPIIQPKKGGVAWEFTISILAVKNGPLSWCGGRRA